MNAQKCLRWFLFQRFYFPRIFVGVAESVQGFPLKPLPSACSFWYTATDYCCQKRHFIFHPIHIATSCLDFHSGRNAAHAEMYFPCTALHRVLFALLIFQTQRQCIFFRNGFKMCQGRVRHRYGFYLMFALSWLYVFFFQFFLFFIPAKVYPSLSLLVGFFLFAFLFTFFLFLLCR